MLMPSTQTVQTIREYPQRARGPRALTADRFGQVFVGDRLSPSDCKWRGTVRTADGAMTSHRLVALRACILMRTARPARPHGIWIGPYYFASAREAYAECARSVRMERAGRLHRGAGPFGQGPRAWSTPD